MTRNEVLVEPRMSRVHINGSARINGSVHTNGTTHGKVKANGKPYANGLRHEQERIWAEGRDEIPGFPSPNEDQEILEPIAIIGMSLKFPQDATSTDGFWEMLLNKRCASMDFPKDRINIDAFYDPDPKKLNKISTRAGHFLKEDVRAFDAPFFSVPPLEAGTMDPQHRGLMETTYHALENAGLSMERISGSNTSVHVGCFTSDFVTMNWRDSQQIPKYSATGTAASILSNRLSWFYDLRGASMTVDTACSSGMVALDLACNGLWSGKSSMAIVAGANLICSPELNIALSNMNFLSPAGRCFSFDSRANGYARGEGFGVLVLKPMSQAVKDGDTIRALIRSVGTNQDGHTNGGITQPSKDQQAQLIAETYRKAGLDKGKTRFFEAHGTGTAIGDPIEARAMGESFKMYRSPTDPLHIGAVKSNLGHLEGASGLAGLIKTVLVLENGLIPPNANFENLNPNIDAEFLNLKFPSKCIPWPEHGVRRASVNSFGFGGANAHVVLDDACHYLQAKGLQGNHYTTKEPNISTSSSAADELLPRAIDTLQETKNARLRTAPPSLLVLSAADEAGISRLAEAYDQYFSTLNGSVTPELLQDIAYTLSSRRSLLPWKSYAVVSPSMLTDVKQALAKPVRTASNMRLGFVFTGQGAQWFAMGRELLACSIFMESLQQSQTYLDSLGCEWSLIDELRKSEDATRIAEPEFSQTLSTVIQVALVDLFEWVGVVPAVVVGHSSGEIAAAYCASLLSHSSAIRVAYYRGVLASKLASSTMKKNTMVSVGLSQSETTTQLKELETQDQGFDASSMTLSCINSPSNVTVSGPERLVDIFIEHLHEQQIFARKLKVNVGYHSPQMHEISTEYLNLLQQLDEGSKGTTALMMSSVTCEIVTVQEACKAQYWVQNMVSPVNFLEAMRLCCFRHSVDGIVKKLDRSHLKEVVSHFWVEIGPHSALQGPFRDILKSVQRSNEVGYSSALIRNKSATNTVLDAVGRLYCRNFAVDMDRLIALGASSVRRRVVKDLPEYPFNHSVMYWEESQTNKAFRFREHAAHELLGVPTADWNPLEAKWKLIIKADDLPWIKDHVINGSVVYPAAGMLAMAIEGSKLLAEGRSPVGFEIKNVEFPAPLLIPTAAEGAETSITLNSVEGSKNEHRFQIQLRKTERDWEKVCHGSIRADYGRIVSEVDGGKEAESALLQLSHLHDRAMISCTSEVDPQKMYKQLKEEVGLDYGPSFQPLDQIRFNTSGESIASIVPFTWSGKVPTDRDPTLSNTIHPATLDGFFQLAFVSLSKGGSVPLRTMVPTRIGKLWISSHGAGNSNSELQMAHAQTETISQRVAQCSISVVGKQDRHPRVHIDELEITAISGSPANTLSQQDQKHLCYHMDWRVDFDTFDINQVQAYCEKQRSFQPDPIEWFKDIETLALSFSAQALAELKDLNREPIPQLARYAAWLQSQLNRDLAATPAETAQNRKELLHDKDHLGLLCDQMASSSKRGELYAKVGQDLTKMLLGDVDPLQLLFNDEQLLADFYEEMNTSSTAFEALASYLDVAVHKDPGMKFLEIGAGTGATTATILKVLSRPDGPTRYSQYAFTDISPSFFDKAQDRFEAEKRMNYRVLNIEEDPIAQGFAEAEYDILIATMVLHATKSLETTLQNARRLLKPGGKLIFMEMTVPNITRTGFAFGLLSGWWLSEEDYRQESPCITEVEWNEVLRRNGFSGTELVFKDFEAEECRGWSVMVSAVMPESPVLPEAAKATLVLDRDDISQQAVADEISHQLEASGNSTDRLTLGEAALLNDISRHHFILLKDLERPVLRNLNPGSFSALQALLASAGSVLWVTTGGGTSPASPDDGMVNGLCRVSRHENQAVPLVTLALEATKDSSPTQEATHIAKVFNRTIKGLKNEDFEPEYTEMNGSLNINRLVEAKYLNDHIFTRTARPVRMQEFGASPALKLNVRNPGLLDSLEFLEDESVDEPLAPNEVLIEIHAIGMNFKECLTVLGRVDSDVLGSDCAGFVTRVGNECTEFQPGDRVLACVLNTYRTFARANTQQVIKIPDTMAFTEAAAIPTTFSTAYYSLYEVARLQKGETILIHAASGGTGQAAVQMAIDIGAEIFATVGSLSKKELLMENYNIPEDHIFYSRDTSFADGVRRMTQGRGVDVVLNSLSGDGLVASWECIAPFGRFIEIGRRDIDSRGYLPMYPFIKNASFSGVDLAGITGKGALGRKVLDGTMDMIRTGRARPPHPLHVYPLAELEQAFRFLQSGKSSGKIVLEVTKSAMVPTVLGPKSNFSFDSNATYVVAGGLGGIGRNISRWLADRGAKNLLLLSRSGPQGNERAQALISDLQAKGVAVQCPSCDITDMESLQNALHRCGESMPPIRGCFQASMVLRDATFTGMSFDDWNASTSPKVQGSWNLHAALPTGMDFFIMLSSVCGVFGNGGQSNYAAGNTYQDALAAHRTARDEKAVALDLGIVLSEGFVAENQHVMDRLMRLGLFLPIEQPELFALFDHYCNPAAARAPPFRGQVVTGLELPANMLAKGAEIPLAMRRPLFRQMHQIDASGPGGAAEAAEQALDAKTAFAGAASLAEAATVVAEALKAKLSRMMGIPAGDIDLGHRVESYGVDSLVAVELRNWLAKEMSADVAVFEILGGATLTGVGCTVATKSSYRKASWQE